MQKNTRILYALAFIKLILPYLLQDPIYEPHRDEMLYLAEGQHMAWGFMEVPPLLSVFAWLTHLFGNGMFWIKFWPSLFGSFTYILVGRIILSLGGQTYALFLGFLSFVLSGYLRVHFLFQPNFLEIFFWTGMAYGLIRWIQTSDNRWLYVFGVAAGLGMMSKYSVTIFIVSICTGLLLTKQRSIFLNRHFYYAALLGLVIFLPNLAWQAWHHFPVIHHMKELRETQLQYINPLNFLVDQLIMLLPVVFFWITGLFYVGFANSAKPYRFIGIAYLFVIALLLIAKGKNYYSLGVYPVLLAFGCYQLEKISAPPYRYWRFVFALIPISLAYFIIPAALPIEEPEQLAALYRKTNMEKFGVLRWEDLKNHPLPQDFSDMLGWEEMARKMAGAYATLDSTEKQHTVLFCDDYGMAGAVNYYGPKYHLPVAYSANASFLYWIPKDLHITHLVLLTDDQKEMEHAFIKEFSSARLYDSITSPYARERGDLVIVLKGASDQFNKFFHEKIEKKKSELNDQ